MPIRPYLVGEGFDPETISEMSDALQSVCKALSLKMIDDAATRAVAQKIIEMAQSGARGADKLHSLALQEFQSE
jgi:hypothetical protein